LWALVIGGLALFLQRMISGTAQEVFFPW